MSLADRSVKNSVFTWFATFIVLVAGSLSFFSLGQLEDPTFTVKTVAVVTSYPGASPKEVEQEVTDRIEAAIQEMSQIQEIQSSSKAGLSTVKIFIEQEYWADRLPQVFDEVRRKMHDIEPKLPPGAGRPVVVDDFGDVYGFLLAVTSDGFSYAELEDHVDAMTKELGLVKGVARVETWGAQQEVVYLEARESQIAEVGITAEELQQTLSQQNVVVDAGSLNVQEERLRIAPSGSFESHEDIGDLVLTAGGAALGGGDELLTLRDVATINRGYIDPARAVMRHDGQPAIGIAIAAINGENVVEVGKRISAKLEEISARTPIGIDIERISFQSDAISQSIDGFFINLLEAVGIVLVVLALSMGLRMGIIIGANLILTIVGTFLVMSMMDIDLQRMSLGALIIAMGMMVDNSIVVADSIYAKLQTGMDRVQAAVESATTPSLPLLGATVVASMAFYPIYASKMNAGEYCRTLFVVVAISLLLSWLLAVTFTPLFCILFLKVKPSSAGEQYGGKFYNGFRWLLGLLIRFRWFVVLLLLAMLIASGAGFGKVSKTFFPDSSMNMFMVDYWAPEGTRIEETSEGLKKIEAKLATDERVEAVSAFVGQGPPRFYLPVEPEGANSSYGHLVVKVRDFREIEEMFAKLQPWVDQAAPGAMVRLRKFAVGPGDTFKIEARFIGPADADPAVLRRLGNEGLAILRKNPHAKDIRTDWRQRTKKVVPEYDQDRGRWSRVSRSVLARATRRAYDGYPIGVYRESDKLLPIVLRNTQEERDDPGRLAAVQIRPPFARESVPLSQVADSVDVEWEDPVIWRWDRRRALTVQADPTGVTGPTLREEIIEDFENIDLPEGYSLMWDGQYKSTKEGQDGLKPGLPPVLLVILLTLVALFNSLRQPLVILSVIPFAAVGVTGGLLIANAPFGFLALLGAGSLIGMMIKNAIVLIDQINVEVGQGKSLYDAIVESTVGRLRPVMLAAATTVLGVIPLLQDVFWQAMAVTIMFGLAFGTILTMLAVPVFYSIIFRVKAEK